MIITKTPLRISFVGGGTDMPAFYERHGGAVVSTAINKYIYVSVNEKFDGRIRVSYSKTENVDTPDELKHDLAAACLRLFCLRGIEITSVSDIPGEGSGLGSSSSFTVGLLRAIDCYCKTNYFHSPHLLAEEAYMIELGCGHPVGKQDHYAAAYGGLHLFKFLKTGTVEVIPIPLEEKELQALQEQMLLFWTGKTRSSSVILKEQNNNLLISKRAKDVALMMRDLAYELYSELADGCVYTIGKYLDRNWWLKKELAENISNSKLDHIYYNAENAGVQGGKICGAGGGGFLLLCAPPKIHGIIEDVVGLRKVPFAFEEKGSEVIYGE